MNKLLIKTHELWLEILMAGFMSSGKNRETLYDYSSIVFRHFGWIEKCLIDRGVDYDYNRGTIPIKVGRLSDILSSVEGHLTEVEDMLSECPDHDMAKRIKSDVYYIKKSMRALKQEKISAFDAERKLDGISLSDEATDALTIFLFEESYKEYELIMVYNHLQAHSDDSYLNNIFQTLIDESWFHFRSFGGMMSQMGILGVPRVIHQSVYQIEDVVGFLKDGIDEEIAAKEMCRELSDAVAKDSVDLADFFDFINNQEDYHISLMKDALKYYEKKDSHE